MRRNRLRAMAVRHSTAPGSDMMAEPATMAQMACGSGHPWSLSTETAWNGSINDVRRSERLRLTTKTLVGVCSRLDIKTAMMTRLFPIRLISATMLKMQATMILCVMSVKTNPSSRVN